MLFKYGEGGNIVAEIVFAELAKGREGMNFQRVLPHLLQRQGARRQVRLIETLRHRTQRDATEERLRQFLADPRSHELRTPLTSIQGFAELFRLGSD